MSTRSNRLRINNDDSWVEQQHTENGILLVIKKDSERRIALKIKYIDKTATFVILVQKHQEVVEKGKGDYAI